MSFALKSGVFARGETIIQRPNGQKDIITPIGDTEIIAAPTGLRGSTTLTNSILVPKNTLGSSTGSYALIGGPSFPPPAFPLSNQGKLPINVPGIPIIRNSTVGTKIASGNEFQTIYPTVIPPRSIPFVSSDSHMISSLQNGSAGIRSSNISNYLQAPSSADQALMASVQQSAFGKRVTTTLPTIQSSEIPQLQPSINQAIGQALTVQPQSIFQPKVPINSFEKDFSGVRKEQNVPIQTVKPIEIWPENDSRKIGPSVFLSYGEDKRRWGVFAWIFAILCLLLLLGLVPFLFLHARSKSSRKQSEQNIQPINNFRANGKYRFDSTTNNWRRSNSNASNNADYFNSKASFLKNKKLPGNQKQANLNAVKPASSTKQPKFEQNKILSIKTVVVQTKQDVPIDPSKIPHSIVNPISQFSTSASKPLVQNIRIEPGPAQNQRSQTSAKTISIFSKQNKQQNKFSAPQLQVIKPVIVSSTPINTKPTYVVDKQPDKQESQFVSTNIVRVNPIIKRQNVPVEFKTITEIKPKINQKRSVVVLKQSR